MAWEKVTKQWQSRGASPILTISPGGQGYLNKAAVALFESRPERVQVFIDKKKMLVGIQAASSEDYSAYAVAPSSTGAQFSIKKAMSDLGIELGKSSQFPVVLEDMLVADLHSAKESGG